MPGLELTQLTPGDGAEGADGIYDDDLESLTLPSYAPSNVSGMPGDLDDFDDLEEINVAPQWGDSPRCSDGSWAIDETRGGGETSGGGEAEAVNSVPPERQPAEDIPMPSSRRSDLSMASSARAARSDRSAASSAQARGRAMASAIRAERSFAEESEYFHRLMDEVRSDVASTRQARQNTRSSRRPMTTRTRSDRGPTRRASFARGRGSCGVSTATVRTRARW